MLGKINISKVPFPVKAGIAEFIGTYILVMIGNGSIAQVSLTHGEKGDFFSINWGWALGVALGILASGGISGGHLNPAVTLALALSKDFPWKRVPVYWLAQYLGALAASGTVLGIYSEAITQNKPNHKFRIQINPNDPGSAAIFANYPAPFISTTNGLIEEILATTIFMLIICVTTDKKSKVPHFLQPFYIGFAMLAIGIAMAGNSGYGLNPARDLAPRLVSYLGGWGPRVFSFRDYNWFWIFIVGPHVGAILGVGIYYLLSKMQQSVQTNEIELPKEEPVQLLNQQQLQESELCDIKCIYDERYHYGDQLPFRLASQKPAPTSSA